MGRQSLEIEVKALHKRIESQKSQRSAAWQSWQELKVEEERLIEASQSTKEVGKEISKILGLISSLNHSIMGAQREYKDKCSLLIKYIVE